MIWWFMEELAERKQTSWNLSHLCSGVPPRETNLPDRTAQPDASVPHREDHLGWEHRPHRVLFRRRWASLQFTAHHCNNYTIYFCISGIKAKVQQKIILLIYSFLTCITFFILCNTKRDILQNDQLFSIHQKDAHMTIQMIFLCLAVTCTCLSHCSLIIFLSTKALRAHLNMCQVWHH